MVSVTDSIARSCGGRRQMDAHCCVVDRIAGGHTTEAHDNPPSLVPDRAVALCLGLECRGRRY